LQEEKGVKELSNRF